MANMVHLHVHTHFSVKDGLGRPEEYAKKAKELGQPALAITDHGETSGLYAMQKACENEGIKPILGSEFYFHHDLGEKLGHLVVLAKDQIGLRNLFKLQEKAFVNNFYYKPRINIEMLKEHSVGLVVTSACLANPINKAILAGERRIADEIALELKNIFGDDFYLEVQPNGLIEQEIVNKELIKMSRRLGIQLVATNDVHYTLAIDSQVQTVERENTEGELQTMEFSPHDVLTSMQFKKKLDEVDRWRFATYDFWLKSREEMEDGFKKYTPQEKEALDKALDNTIVIADKCNAKLEKGNYLPHYHDIPKGKSEEQLLRELVTKKYKENIIDKGMHNKEYANDVFGELDVICGEGYSGYFLIVQDYINAMRDRGITVGDGRGSGAGSKVSHVLGISKVNPQEFNLLFERFLSIGRTPDIDTDFSDIDAVYDYLVEQRGVKSVARIRSYGKLTAKACVRNVFSTFCHKQSTIKAINSCMPIRPSFTLKEALEESSDLRRYKEMYPEEFFVVERLEGTISHFSQHAGGLIMWDEISDVLPVVSDSSNREKLIVALDMDELEELGHFKFDALGLQTLEVIQRALESINSVEGKLIDLDYVDKEDKRVYQAIASGDLNGVFQIEEQADAVMRQKPKNFEDLITINAIIRPGVAPFDEYIARREGKEYYLNPLRESYMRQTEGLFVYQEQYMQDANVFAGWGFAFSDRNIRKNKRIASDVDLREKFIQDSTSNGHDKEEMTELWDEIVKTVSGGYGFNKAHATSYAVLTYKTAWLKVNYPYHFYASLLTQVGSDQAKVSDIIASIRKKGLKILPPDINLSTDNFMVTENGIGYKLTSLTGVADSAIREIEKIRPIEGLEDMLARATKRGINKTALTSLIKAGVFDFEEPNRIKLLHKAYEIRKYKPDLPDVAMWSAQAKSLYEMDSFGLYLTEHPIERFGYPPLTQFKNDGMATIAGEVMSVARIRDRKDNPMAFIELSSQYGVTKLIVFSYVWNDKRNGIQGILEPGRLVEVKGKRSNSDLLVNSANELY